MKQYDGLVEGLHFDDYLRQKNYSNSFLKQVLISPKNAKWQMDHPNESNDTPSLSFGRLVHTFILEPHLFEKEVIATELASDKRKKAYKDFAAEHEDLTIISMEQLRELHDIKHSIESNEFAAALLDEGKPEVSMFWEDSGFEFKGRIDFLRKDHILVDLKTCQNALPRKWDFDARFKYHYNMQAALYTHGYSLITGEVPEFYFVCVENTPPYDCVVRRCDKYFIDEGREYVVEALDLLAESLATEHWKGKADEDIVALTASESYFGKHLFQEKNKSKEKGA